MILPKKTDAPPRSNRKFQAHQPQQQCTVSKSVSTHCKENNRTERENIQKATEQKNCGIKKKKKEREGDIKGPLVWLDRSVSRIDKNTKYAIA